MVKVVIVQLVVVVEDVVEDENARAEGPKKKYI